MAQTKRGAFASGWWAKRWIAVLEAFELGTRLARGRSYARGGQVTQIALELGGVRAQVQGSRAKPYDVTIRLRPLDTKEWRSVAAAIANDVRLCTALLAGEMPEHIERAFSAAGTSLFPLSLTEMKTSCSCPDWSNPCKHVAAVFYLVGEEFDRDPFLLFVVRGLARDAVSDLFAPKPEPIATIPCATKVRPAQISPAAFWGDNIATPAHAIRRIEVSATDEPAVLKRAGKFPFWREAVTLGEALVPIYTDAATFALDWLASRRSSRTTL